MKYKLHFFVCLLLFILYAYNGYAQTQKSESLPDTVSQKHFNNDDKISDWKQSRDFAYIHYLDSLLRKEKNLKADTASIDESNGIKINTRPKNNNSSINQFLNSLPLKIFFWTLALFFIGYIFYKTVFKNSLFVRKKNKLLAKDEKQFSGDLNEASEYDNLILEAEEKNNFRLAVRYLFLKTLKLLSDKGFINFAIEKTNQEYLSEMNPNNYHKEFQKLVRDYEYIWYGQFLIDKNNYRQLKEAFILFNEKV